MFNFQDIDLNFLKLRLLGLAGPPPRSAAGHGQPLSLPFENAVESSIGVSLLDGLSPGL